MSLTYRGEKVGDRIDEIKTYLCNRYEVPALNYYVPYRKSFSKDIAKDSKGMN